MTDDNATTEELQMEHQEHQARLLPTIPIKRTLPFNKDESLTKIEESLNQLVSELSEFEELRQIVEMVIENSKKEDDKFKTQFIRYFNDFNSRADRIIEKLQNEVEYTRNLDDKIRANTLEQQVYVLDKSLIEERAQITHILTDISRTVSEKLTSVEEKVNALESISSIIEDNISKYKSDMRNLSDNELKSLKIDYDEALKKFLTKAQETLETVKTQAINFLKQCEKENTELIKKVPAVEKSRYCVKDIILYVMSFLCLSTVILQFIL